MSHGVAALARARLGRTLGLWMAFVGMLRYRSQDHHEVLGRWSNLFAVVAGAMAALCLASAIDSWRRRRREARHPDATGVSVATILGDYAFLAWGAGYLLASVDRETEGGRLLDLNLVGSIMAPAALLEWTAIVLVCGALVAYAVPRLRSGALANALMVAVAMSSAIVAAEGIARCWILIDPQPRPFPTYGTSIWLRRFAQLNQNSYRDGEHELIPATPRRRLAVIGDSYAFGWGIDDVRDRFGERLGDLLALRTRETWEVINASAPNRNTIQEMEFVERSLRYRPDLVVLLYVFNDIDYLRPITLRNVISEAPSTMAQRLHPLRVAYKNSYLFQELYVRLGVMRGWFQDLSGSRAYNVYADSAILTRHFADLSRLVRSAECAGAAVLIVPFDVAIAASPEARARYDRFVRQGVAAELPIVSIADSLVGRPISDLTINALDRHPSELANRLAAGAVAPHAASTSPVPPRAHCE